MNADEVKLCINLNGEVADDTNDDPSPEPHSTNPIDPEKEMISVMAKTMNRLEMPQEAQIHFAEGFNKLKDYIKNFLESKLQGKVFSEEDALEFQQGLDQLKQMNKRK